MRDLLPTGMGLMVPNVANLAETVLVDFDQLSKEAVSVSP